LALILTTPRNRQRPHDPIETGDRVETGEENFNRGIRGAHPTLLGPRMDIPAFEQDRPRWWIRWCKRVFYEYRVAKREKVNVTHGDLFSCYFFFLNAVFVFPLFLLLLIELLF